MYVFYDTPIPARSPLQPDRFSPEPARSPRLPDRFSQEPARSKVYDHFPMCMSTLQSSNKKGASAEAPFHRSYSNVGL